MQYAAVFAMENSSPWYSQCPLPENSCSLPYNRCNNVDVFKIASNIRVYAWRHKKSKYQWRVNFKIWTKFVTVHEKQRLVGKFMVGYQKNYGCLLVNVKIGSLSAAYWVDWTNRFLNVEINSFIYTIYIYMSSVMSNVVGRSRAIS